MINGRIGFEFEGFISNINLDKLKKFCKKKKIEVCSDGSINFNRTYENETTIVNYSNDTTIELNGLGLIFNIKDTTKIYKLFKDICDLGFKVNDSCGLHIHLSFMGSSNYYKLLRYNFVKQFEDKIKDILISDYEKLRLKQHYCRLYEDDLKTFKKDTTTQILSYGKSGSRYHSINFNSFNLHHTIEFRIFPATQNINNFKKYLQFLLKNVEDYLKTTEKIAFSISKDDIKTTNEPIIIKIKKDNTQQTDTNTPTPARENLTHNTTYIDFNSLFRSDD